MSARDDLVAEDVAELLLSIGWKCTADAQWHGLTGAIPKLRALLAPLDAEPVAYFVDQGGSGEMDLGLFHLTREEAEQDCVDGDRIVSLYARPEASNDAELVRKAAEAYRIVSADGDGADRLTALADRLDGGVIVPREPTQRMKSAGVKYAFKTDVGSDWQGYMDGLYRAMLAASEAK